ncbi:MAG: hypothetical protein KC425_14515 [Anaerolineales bacterium]|nr:hypothetical protein [Anaerolineales bacterium]
MNDAASEAILIQCLDEFEAGVPAEEILRRYPDYADALRPILSVADRLSSLAAEPTASAEAASEALFLAHGRAMRQVARAPRTSVTWWRRLAAGLALAVLLLVSGLTLVQESASALPGDPLYGVKLARENLRLSLTQDETTAADLQQAFQAERVTEIRSLLALDREATVNCEGQIETIAQRVWIICGMQVVVDDQTEIVGTPAVGSRVQVAGFTRSRAFVAARIVVVDDGAETAVPTATATQTLTATPTDTATPTATLTATPSPSPSPTQTPTLTATPTRPAPTDTPAPVIVPTVDDDDDDDGHDITDPGDDNDGNDNGGNDNGDDNDDDGDDDDNSGHGSGDDNDDDNSGHGSGDDDDNDD